MNEILIRETKISCPTCSHPIHEGEGAFRGLVLNRICTLKSSIMRISQLVDKLKDSDLTKKDRVLAVTLLNMQNQLDSEQDELAELEELGVKP